MSYAPKRQPAAFKPRPLLTARMGLFPRPTGLEWLALAAILAVLAFILSGCALLVGSSPQRPVPASEVMRLRALPDAQSAAIAAPIFYRDALTTVSRLQSQLDAKP